MEAFPKPVGGASLLVAFRPVRRIVIIVGGNPLAALRAFAALQADANVFVVVKGGLAGACEELRWRAGQKQLELLDFDVLPSSQAGPDDPWRDGKALDTFIYQLPNKPAMVCVTDTVVGPTGYRRGYDAAFAIARECRHRQILVTVADIPDLCDFTFLSTHRFSGSEAGSASPLQVGVTTNGHGCRLAGRIRRDIAASLPKELGSAVEKVGRLRAQAKESHGDEEGQDLNEDGAPVTPNEPVPQRKEEETEKECGRRRMKWVAQVSEYWPIRRLAQMSDEDMAAVLNGREGLHGTTSPSAGDPSHVESSATTPVHGLALTPPRRGRVFLVGSGPGHPSLLTVATHAALTKHDQLVLSDKLVPDAVLALIPPGVEVRIARKFPGNADGAQQELMEAAVEAAKRGLTVVRVSLCMGPLLGGSLV